MAKTKKFIVLIGVGEMGGVFARGLLKFGYPVYPLLRNTDFKTAAKELSDPEAVIVAVGEKDLHSVLEDIPEAWRDKLVLLQNELLPKDWESHNVAGPTVISVWFEKKQPKDYKVIIPSPVFGPKAGLIHSALESIGIPCIILKTADELLFELILKNLYIVTTNVAGLEAGGTVGQLWSEHNALAREVADNVLDIQFWLAGKEFNREKLIDGMVHAFQGDLEHKCMGRSAPARLERALSQADEAGLAVKKIRDIRENFHANAKA